MGEVAARTTGQDEPAPASWTRPAGWAPVDVHTHTTLSDGTATPTELVERAAAAGVEVLAVTDHDTTEGVAEAVEAGRARGLRVIPGMEVSARLDGRVLHVLGYFPPAALGALGAWQAARRAARRVRVERMLERLAALGVPVELAAILQGADPRRAAGRLHVARALVAAGHVATTHEAFERYLGAGKPAYVEDEVPDAAGAVALIRDLGGLSSVAHPLIDGHDARLDALSRAGVEALEAYHASHPPEEAARLAAAARDLGLLVTGGSDYHGEPPRGPGAPPSDAPAVPPRLGATGLPPEAWAHLDAALAARAGA